MAGWMVSMMAAMRAVWKASVKVSRWAVTTVEQWAACLVLS